MQVEIRLAVPADLAGLKRLIERAYRGETARRGWSHEADLVRGERIALGDLATLLSDPASRLIVATHQGDPIGCVHIRLADPSAGLGYLGLLCVDPDRQAAGLGSRLILRAEAEAHAFFGVRLIEMTVIDSRTALIAFYERRGYRPTGERRPFPVPLDPPIEMIVLAKSLVSAQ